MKKKSKGNRGISLPFSKSVYFYIQQREKQREGGQKILKPKRWTEETKKKRS
jgi:hypothetical protein